MTGIHHIKAIAGDARRMPGDWNAGYTPVQLRFRI